MNQKPPTADATPVLRLGDMVELKWPPVVKDHMTGALVPAVDFADHGPDDPLLCTVDGFITITGDVVFTDTNHEVVAILYSVRDPGRMDDHGLIKPEDETWWSIEVENISQGLPRSPSDAYHQENEALAQAAGVSVEPPQERRFFG